MKLIFEQQQNFQKVLNADIHSQEYKNLMFLGLFSEVGEALKETSYKKHRQTEFNKNKFLNECVDAQLYLFNLVLSEISYEEYIKLLHQKQQINLMRVTNEKN